MLLQTMVFAGGSRQRSVRHSTLMARASTSVFGYTQSLQRHRKLDWGEQCASVNAARLGYPSHLLEREGRGPDSQQVSHDCQQHGTQAALQTLTWAAQTVCLHALIAAAPSQADASAPRLPAGQTFPASANTRRHFMHAPTLPACRRDVAHRLSHNGAGRKAVRRGGALGAQTRVIATPQQRCRTRVVSPEAGDDGGEAAGVRTASGKKAHSHFLLERGLNLCDARVCLGSTFP